MSSTTAITTKPQLIPLSIYTSHLSRRKLSRVLYPSHWRPLYLSVLNISVLTSLSYSLVLPIYPGLDPPLDLGDEDYLRLNLAVSGQLLVSATDLSKPTSILREILCFCSRLDNGLQGGIQILVLLNLITCYLLKYVKPCYSRLVQFSDAHQKRSQFVALGLKYRGITVSFDPPATIHRKSSQDSTLPILTFITPHRPRSDYSCETAFLLSLAQSYFIGFPYKEFYQPYVLTIRRYTRIIIVTAKVEQAYIDSMDEKKFPHETGKDMKVLVSEEFDLALVGDRGRFLGVYRELLISLIVREGVVGDSKDTLKRKREDVEVGDSTDGEEANRTEGTDGGNKSNRDEETPASSQESTRAQNGSKKPRLSHGYIGKGYHEV